MTNECYQCKAPIDTPQEVVHPLCESCEEKFQEWLTDMFNEIGI